MSETVENYQPKRFVAWATIALIVVNVIAFGGQVLAARYVPHFPLDDYFALSLDGIRHHYFWQLLTFQFMHGGYMHLVVNSWCIYIFGRIVEISIGWRRMLRLYFVSGVVGGLAQLLGMLLLPGLFGNIPVIGASAGAVGLAAAFAVLYPNQVLVLFIPFPIPMRARSFISFFVVFSLVGIFYPFIKPHVPARLDYWIGGMFINVAHAAHLGGLLAGAVIAKRLIRRKPSPPVIVPPKTSLNITPVGD